MARSRVGGGDGPKIGGHRPDVNTRPDPPSRPDPPQRPDPPSRPSPRPDTSSRPSSRPSTQPSSRPSTQPSKKVPPPKPPRPGAKQSAGEGGAGTSPATLVGDTTPADPVKPPTSTGDGPRPTTSPTTPPTARPPGSTWTMGQAVGGGASTITYTRPAFTTAKPSGPRPAGKEPFDFGNKQKTEQDLADINAKMDSGDVDGARQKLTPLLETAESSKNSGRIGHQREGKAIAKELVARLDVRTKTGQKDFWSGDKHLAGKFAEKDGHTILEQTNGARVTDDWGRVNDALPWNNGGEQLWGGLSAKYASDADGKDLRIIQTEGKFPFGGDIWRNYEWPQVKAQGKVETIAIHKVDKQGNVEETVFMDPKTEKVFDKDGNEFKRDFPEKNSTSRVDPNGNVLETKKVINWSSYEQKKFDPQTGEVTEWKHVSKDGSGVETTTFKDADGNVTKVTKYDPKTGTTTEVPQGGTP